MPTPPMPFEADVTTVLSVARSAVRDLSRAPKVFIPGERAASELVMTLEALSQFGGLNQTTLAAHLMPCRQALKSILEVRGKYPLDNFGFGDRMKWNLDERRFENDVEELRLGTQRLRETAQAIREARAPSQTQPDTNQTKLVCHNGSGCRQPGCGLRNDHPRAPTCKDGKDCCAPGCTKFHPKTGHCPNGPTCPNISGCPKAHPWPRPSPQAADGWCLARQSCPGYDGACPLKHPRKAPCKNGSSCWKRQTCSYDHSPQAPQSQLPAELPAGVHSQDRNRTARVELPATGR